MHRVRSWFFLVGTEQKKMKSHTHWWGKTCCMMKMCLWTNPLRAFFHSVASSWTSVEFKRRVDWSPVFPSHSFSSIVANNISSKFGRWNYIFVERFFTLLASGNLISAISHYQSPTHENLSKCLWFVYFLIWHFLFAPDIGWIPSFVSELVRYHFFRFTNCQR